MKTLLSHRLGAAAFALVAALAAADPALAGTPTPGPLLGAGAPVLAIFGAGYYFIKKRRGG